MSVAAVGVVETVPVVVAKAVNVPAAGVDPAQCAPHGNFLDFFILYIIL
jgi:hypothetical protein